MSLGSAHSTPTLRCRTVSPCDAQLGSLYLLAAAAPSVELDQRHPRRIISYQCSTTIFQAVSKSLWLRAPLDITSGPFHTHGCSQPLAIPCRERRLIRLSSAAVQSGCASLLLGCLLANGLRCSRRPLFQTPSRVPSLLQKLRDNRVLIPRKYH
ncbi:hypothetical protein OE88DRAFT_1377412 [Heliocybe sulcata]|uniref:Uncharacterized protein n=1 Tax=Heliocybe sulcata TaxID=5364 RepID=A0A5C3N5D3_9AGAM|nr:hypothetical protein OE88DRAFT_1377412 [Heliocybe sulcata]